MAIFTVPAVVDKIVAANDRIRYYDLSFDTSSEFFFQPGQFVSVIKPAEPRKIMRPYSIASTPAENAQGVLKLVVTEVTGGKVSPWIHSWQEGQEITFKGAFGSFTIPDTAPQEVHFVSVGTGIAPFRSIILDLMNRGTDRQIVLYNGNRHEDSILYDEDFLTLAQQHENFRYIPCVSRPLGNWSGARGYVQQQVRDTIGEPGGKLVMICGINAMIDDVCGILAERGFPKEAVHFERYD